MILRHGVVLENGAEMRAMGLKVLPCPFCGSADAMQYLDDKVHWPSVTCCECGATMHGDTRWWALFNWNRRPGDVLPPGLPPL